MGKYRLTKEQQKLVYATLNCLAEHGYHGTTIRRITASIGTNVSMVQYHFGGKANLMRSSYRHFRHITRENYGSLAATADPDPVRQLETRARAIFNSRALMGRKMTRLWISFLDLVNADSETSAMRTEIYEYYVGELADCINRIPAGRGGKPSSTEAHRLAVGIYSVIDGLWLEHALNPSGMSPDEAMEIAMELIGARIDVSISSGHSHPGPAET